MASSQNYLAIDLGAETGRAMLGQHDGQRLRLSEAHRFPNVPVRLPDGLDWDVLRFERVIYTPQGQGAWDAAFLRFVALLEDQAP